MSSAFHHLTCGISRDALHRTSFQTGSDFMNSALLYLSSELFSFRSFSLPIPSPSHSPTRQINSPRYDPFWLAETRCPALPNASRLPLRALTVRSNMIRMFCSYSLPSSLQNVIILAKTPCSCSCSLSPDSTHTHTHAHTPLHTITPHTTSNLPLRFPEVLVLLAYQGTERTLRSPLNLVDRHSLLSFDKVV